MLTAERLEERRQGIGGSDAAVILGLSPYKTALDLYQEKLGLVDPPDLAGNDAVHFGNVLENVVAEEFARRTRLKVRRNNQLLVHPEHPFLLANIDRGVVGRPMGVKCGLECKTAGTWAARPELWGEGATFDWDSQGNINIVQFDDQVPDWYLLQSAHYMAVTDSDLWFLAVLIGGQDFRVYTLRRDRDLEDIIVRRESEFWRNHVERQVPPPPSSVADIMALYPRDNGASIVAPAEIVEACEEAKALQGEIKAREIRLSELKDQIRTAIGPNAEILLDSGSKPLATWKTRAIADGFDKKRLALEHPDLYQQYTTTGNTTRVLLLK